MSSTIICQRQGVSVVFAVAVAFSLSTFPQQLIQQKSREGYTLFLSFAAPRNIQHQDSAHGIQ